MENTKKIKVSICTGTACFVMGASEILVLEDSLPDELKGIVEIEGLTCLEKCKNTADFLHLHSRNSTGIDNIEIEHSADIPVFVGRNHRRITEKTPGACNVEFDIVHRRTDRSQRDPHFQLPPSAVSSGSYFDIFAVPLHITGLCGNSN